MAEKFPNFKKEIDIQVQEVQNIPDRMNPKKSTQKIYLPLLSYNPLRERGSFTCQLPKIYFYIS